MSMVWYVCSLAVYSIPVNIWCTFFSTKNDINNKKYAQKKRNIMQESLWSFILNKKLIETY